MKSRFQPGIAKSRKNKANSIVYTTRTAINSIYEALPTLGSSLVTLSAIAYLVSYLRLKGYYEEIGATWFLPTISPGSVIASGIGIYTVLFIAVSITIYSVSEKYPSKKISLIWGYAAIVGLLLHFISMWNPVQLPYWLSITIMIFKFFIMLIVIGLIFAEIIASFKEEKLKWNFAHLSRLVFAYTLYISPQLQDFGSEQAKIDMDSSRSKLPYAQKIGCQECIWRIVNIYEGKVFLARLSTDKRSRKFLFITMDDKWEIQEYNAK